MQLICERWARHLRTAQRLEDLAVHFHAEAGGDSETFDPWDDHGV